MAAIDQLSSLASILQTVQGTETKSKTKGTQTQQTQISDTGVNKLIQDILSGPGGVRSIGGAARSTGLFNATTEDLLLGDLYSRAAVSAELARSPTVTTTNQTAVQETPGVGLGAIGGAIAAGQAGKLLFGSGGEGGLLSGAGEAVSNLFGGGGAAAAATPAVTQGVTSATGALAGATPGAIVNAGVAGTAGGALAGAGGASAAGAAGAGAAGTGLGFNATTAIPLGGSFLGGLLGGREASQEPGSLAVSALAGAAALGPIGLIAAPLASIAGGFLRDLSVVCTALHRKGLITKQLHAAGDRYFQTLNPVVKVGYWMWGTWVARKIDSGSVFWTLFTLPIVKSYLRFLSGPKTLLSCYDHPLGGFAHFVGEPVCRLLGHLSLYWDTKIKQY